MIYGNDNGYKRRNDNDDNTNIINNNNNNNNSNDNKTDNYSRDNSNNKNFFMALRERARATVDVLFRHSRRRADSSFLQCFLLRLTSDII